MEIIKKEGKELESILESICEEYRLVKMIFTIIIPKVKPVCLAKTVLLM